MKRSEHSHIYGHSGFGEIYVQDLSGRWVKLPVSAASMRAYAASKKAHMLRKIRTKTARSR